MYLIVVKTMRYDMLKVRSVKDIILKFLLLSMVSLVFLTTSFAFGNAVFGVIAGALYIYEIVKL